MEEEIRVPTGPREIAAYLVRPDSSPSRRPAVIVIHEIFGPDAHIREVTRRFASRGYVAVAPNLFSGELERVLTPPNIMLGMRAFAEAPPDLRAHPEKMAAFATSQPPDRRPVLQALGRVMDPTVQAGFARDLAAVARYLRGRPEVDPARIASVGFCFGGAMSGRLATVDSELRAAVIFYGQNPPLDQVPNIRAHVLGLYGAEDAGITNTVPELAAAMEQAGRSFEYHVYPGAKHAFFNDTRPSNYHKESAEDAGSRVFGFLQREFARPEGP